MRKCWLGIDGTRTGWVVFVWSDDGEHQLWHINTLSQLELLTSRHIVDAIAVDIPIGLLDVAQKGGRGCDREARRLLSSAKRNVTAEKGVPLVGSSSIFTPPSRKALSSFGEGATHAQVSAANKQSIKDVQPNSTTSGEGLGLSIQTYHILPKIKEADDFVSASTSSHAVAFDGQVPIFECHPELAFLSLSLSSNKGSRMGLEIAKGLYSKKTIQGRRQRLDLLCGNAKIDAHKLLFLSQDGNTLSDSTRQKAIEQLSTLNTWRLRSLSSDKDGLVPVAADDVLDAIICATTSRKWSSGQARAVREEEGDEACDGHGLPMLIWA